MKLRKFKKAVKKALQFMLKTITTVLNLLFYVQTLV